MNWVLLVVCVVCSVSATPAQDDADVSSRRLMDTPLLPCPEGEKRVAGECRKVFRDIQGRSVLTVPDKPCPRGMRRDSAGNCNLVVRRFQDTSIRRIIDVPSLPCSEDEVRVNGKCRKVFRDASEPSDQLRSRSVIDFPDKPCPKGMRRDDLGKCNYVVRNLLDANIKKIIDVPTLPCPDGYVRINGKCRKVFKKSGEEDSQIRSVIDIPDKPCPKGMKRDDLGNCNYVVKGLNPEVDIMKVIDVPDKKCPEGFRMFKGKCRKIFKTVSDDLDQTDSSLVSS